MPVNPTGSDNDPRQKLAEAMAELQAGRAALNRAATALEETLQALAQTGINALPSPDVPVSAHRRAHRMGRAPKIDSDPELQAFITVRIDRMTFVEIAAEVARHFPPARRVGKSAIHDWWKKQGDPGRSAAG